MSLLLLGKETIALLIPHMSESDKLEMIGLLATSMASQDEAPIEAPTEAPIEAPTEAPIEAPIDPVTVTSTEAPIDPVTVTPIDPVTVTSTEADTSAMFCKGKHQLLAKFDNRRFVKTAKFKEHYYNGCTSETTKGVMQPIKAYMLSNDTFTPFNIAPIIPKHLVKIWETSMLSARYFVGRLLKDGEIMLEA
jgi:hypothetical protein